MSNDPGICTDIAVKVVTDRLVRIVETDSGRELFSINTMHTKERPNAEDIGNAIRKVMVKKQFGFKEP